MCWSLGTTSIFSAVILLKLKKEAKCERKKKSLHVNS